MSNNTVNYNNVPFQLNSNNMNSNVNSMNSNTISQSMDIDDTSPLVIAQRQGPDANTTSVDIQKVLSGDAQSIRTLKLCLQARGWCFVDLSNEFMVASSSCLQTVSQFLAQSQQVKQNHAFEPHFGYFTNEFKQGYRMLTGPYLKQIPTLAPQVTNFAISMDSLCQAILYKCGPYLFNGEDGLKQMIPLIASNKQNVDRSFHDSLGVHLPTSMRGVTRMANSIRRDVVGYGMLDIVRYEHSLSQNLNVTEHVDPGLFSISLQSTAPGLQMYDNSTNSYVDVPIGQSVLWTGSMASHLTAGNIYPGRHRVVTTNQPRMTLWYEVCIDSQVPNFLLKNQPFVIRSLTPPTNTKLVRVKMGNRLLELNVPESATMDALIQHIERTDGIPPTKRGPSSFWRNNIILPFSQKVSEIDSNDILDLR